MRQNSGRPQEPSSQCAVVLQADPNGDWAAPLGCDDGKLAAEGEGLVWTEEYGNDEDDKYKCVDNDSVDISILSGFHEDLAKELLPVFD